jgi:hypothetical protein
MKNLLLQSLCYVLVGVQQVEDFWKVFHFFVLNCHVFCNKKKKCVNYTKKNERNNWLVIKKQSIH